MASNRASPSEDLPEYVSLCYEPLPKTRGAIRILQLKAGSVDNPNIECELITPKSGSPYSQNSSDTNSESKDDGKISLRDRDSKGWKDRYEALSWCWGNEEETSFITIRQDDINYKKWVRPNLFAALKALRHLHQDRYLWCDAICIDQDHAVEKNHQVEQMDEIYGNAMQVCIWLGDEDGSSKKALEFIDNEILRLQDFDALCDSNDAGEKWGALLNLMQRAWFSRRWVVQEIALARVATMYCGTDQISWNKFAVAVELFVEVETATHRLSEVMKKDKNYYHIPGWFDYVSELGASLLVDATGRLFRDFKVEQPVHTERYDDFVGEEYYQSALGMARKYSSAAVNVARNLTNISSASRSSSLSVKNNKAQPLLGLEYLVTSLSVFDTSMPHDTIFALLAIAKDTTPVAAGERVQKSSDHAQDVLELFTQRKRYNVDYDLPYVDVCKEFIQFCILQSLHWDRSRALDVICRPWATEETILARRRHEKVLKEEREESEKKMAEWLQRKRESFALNRGYQNENMVSMNGEATVQNQRTPDANTGVNSKPSTETDSRTGVSVRAKEVEDMELPSWVPQLSGAPFAMYEQAGVKGVKMNRKNADPLVGLPSTTQRNYAAAGNRKINMKVLKFRKRFKMGYYSLFVEGFVLDKIAEVSSMSRNGQIPQEWAQMGCWTTVQNHPPGDPPDEFWRTLVADRGRDGKNPPVYYARACKESFAKGGFVGGAVNTTDLMHYERNSVVAQFCRRVQAVIWNRALVKTESGRLGLVGRDVRKGDHVCILYGCSVPVILRMSDKKTREQYRHEQKQELKFLANFVSDKWLQYSERSKEHQKRKEIQTKMILKWNKERWKQWQKDEEWHNGWEKRLDEEQQSKRVAPYEHEYEPEVMKELRQDPKPDDEVAWRDRLTSRSFSAWKKVKTEEERVRNNRIRQAEENAQVVKKPISTEALGGTKTTNVNSDLSDSTTTDDEEQPAKANSNETAETKEETTVKEKITTVFRLPEVNGHLIVDWRTFDLRLKYYRRWKQNIAIRKKRIQRRIQEVCEAIEKEWKEQRWSVDVPKECYRLASARNELLLKPRLKEVPIVKQVAIHVDIVPSSPVGSIRVDLNKPSMPNSDAHSSLNHEAMPLQHGEASEPHRPSKAKTWPESKSFEGYLHQRLKMEEAKKRLRLEQWLHHWRDNLRKEKKFAELAQCEDLTKEKEEEINYWRMVNEEYAKKLEDEYWSKIEEEYWKERKKRKTATELLEVRKSSPEDKQGKIHRRESILSEYKLYWTQTKKEKTKTFEQIRAEARKQGGIRKYRRCVTEDGRKDYNEVIRHKFWEGLKEDGYFSWKFLGEAYVHGMMDGEAMKWQNENGILPRVFELR